MADPPTITGAEFLAHQAKQRRGRRWSAAIPTERAGLKDRLPCEVGYWRHRHASRLEGRCCQALTGLARAHGGYVLQQVRFPLLGLAPSASLGDRPFTVTIDFVLVVGATWAAIDAKGRHSREWARGAAAFQATYGRPIQVVTDAAAVVDCVPILKEGRP